MKKLGITTLLFVFFIKAYAYDFSAVCETGQTLYYHINEGVLFEVTLMAPSYPSWTGYVRPVGDVVIPEHVEYQGQLYTVVTIDGDAFMECTELTSVVVPNSVTYIGSLAFYGDTGLESVVLPTGLVSIEDWSFLNCSSLTSVNFPDSLVSIGELAFTNCSSLSSISLPNTLETIGSSAFSGCSALNGNLELPSSLQSFGEGCFSQCTGLTGVVFPENLSIIPEMAFFECTGLTGSLVIPDQCTLIGPEAFSGCSNLSSLTIGSSVATIGHSAFMDCTGLEIIYCNTPTLPYTPPLQHNHYDPNEDQHVIFYNVPADIPVYVNCLAIDQFQASPHWSQFTNMEGVFLNAPALTVTVNNSEYGTAEVVSIPEDCDNTMAMVRALAYPGHVFGYWKKNGVVVSDTPEYSFTLDHDCVLTACFDYFATVYDSIGYPDHVIGQKFNAENQLIEEFVSDFSYNPNGVLDHYYYPDAYYISTNFVFLAFPSMPSSIHTTYGNGTKSSYRDSVSNRPPPITTEAISNYYEDDHQLRHTDHYKGNSYYVEINNQYDYFYDDHRLIQKDSRSQYENNGQWQLWGQNRYAYENGNKTRIDSAFSESGSNLRLSTVTTNQYDDAHRILTSQTDTYNASGTITSQTLKTYTYTSRNRTDSIITQVLNDNVWINSSFAHYVYDFKNRVIEYQTGSWSAENATWDVTKKICYDFDDERQKEIISFWKTTNGEWVRDVFSRESLFQNSQLNEWQRQLNNFATSNINQFEITLHYNIVEQQFPILSGWYYEIEEDNGNITYQHLEYLTDTVINGDKPKVIVRTNQIYDKKRHTEITHEYIKEQEGKVYWWNKELHEFTTLYDYTANVGDEWEIKVGTESIMVHVDSVGNFEYQGDLHRVLHVSDAANVVNGDIVVGLGHLTSFFPEKMMRDTKGFSVNGLRCYWVGDALLYHNGDVDCDAVHAGNDNVNEMANGSEVFSIHPNPTDGLIHVERHDATTSGVYCITNLLGQTLMSGMVPSQPIDVSALPVGMYFLTIDGKTLKFTKQ